MEYVKKIDGDTCNILLQGKFTFSDHLTFKEFFNLKNNKDIKNININLEKVEFIDSAALGLLLLMKDETDSSNISLCLVKPANQVKKMFQISRFYELFNITD